MTETLQFDPTYGYDRRSLLSVKAPDGPPDFDAFWTQRHTSAIQLPLDLETTWVARRDDLDVYEIAFSSEGGFRVSGWLTRPRSGDVRRGLVISHGYADRFGPDDWVPVDDAAVIYPCARGLGASRGRGVPNEVARHIVHGIQSRDTYVIGGCVVDVWAAASALLEVVPEAAARLEYIGTSFGGGIGALALPWDHRFSRACLGLPTFGHHPLRLRLDSLGSLAPLRAYVARHPEATAVLAYFDAATAARRITIPTLAIVALFDPAVPPPGQFAVANALAGEKELLVVPFGHWADDSNEQVRDAQTRFFA